MGNKLIIAFVAGLITLVVYLPVLQNEFVNWDDNIYVYENQNIRHIDLDFIRWSFSDASVGHWHPVTWFSLALDYAFWGLNPWGFHLTNIILHSLNTLLVFILAMRLVEEESRGQRVKGSEYAIGRPAGSPLRTTNYELRTLVAAFVTALLFGIHPVHVESVAWVTERKDVLSLLFFLMTLLSYIQYNVSKKRGYYGATLLLFTIALMTKPMVVTLPIILLILDFYPFRRLAWKESKWVIIEKIPFFLLSLISSLITVWGAGSAGAMKNHFDLITRLFISARGYLFYIVKMIVPVNLAPLYPYPEMVNIFAFDYLGSALLLLSITIYCFWSLRRGRLVFAVWMYYIITLLPVIGIVHAGPQDTANRYTYMPSIGPFLLIGLAIGNLFERLSKRTIPITLLLLLLSGILIDKTVKQIGIWHDSITFWSYEIKLYPDNVDIAYLNRGNAYHVTGKGALAISDFNRALQIKPNDVRALRGRGYAYFALGEYQQAIKDYTKALELNSKSFNTYNRRGNAYYNLGDYQQAIKDYNMAIEIEPQFKPADIKQGSIPLGMDKGMQAALAELYYNRGTAYSSLENYEEALKDYDRAIELDPLFSRAYNNKGKAYFALGNYQQAIADIRKAVEIDPSYARAYHNLSIIYSKLGQADEASAYYKKAESLGFKPSQ